MTDNAPNVAVLIATDTSWGRRVIRGVTQYARTHGPWHLIVTEHGSNTPILPPAGWRGDGVIARISDIKIQEQLLDLEIPVINVSAVALPNKKFPKVMIDYKATAEMAAHHFLERGFRHMAYVGPMQHDVVQRHAAAFHEAIEERGVSYQCFDYQSDDTSPEAWAKREKELGDWLNSLPKPAGVFSWATEAGARVLDACRHQGLAVPVDIAVLADDDDPLLCHATTPEMSAVLHAAEQVGYHAAARLGRMLEGEPDDGETEYISPVDITSRGSTESYAIDDREMVRAITFIRQNAMRQISVPEIADFVPMGRRTLERKFRQTFGRTPFEEIRRLRIKRVREMLTKTDMSVQEIAEKSGFTSPEYMSNTFRKLVGMSPSRFRKKVQGR